MEHIKTITSVPGWSELFANGSEMSGVSMAYSQVPLFRRAVDLRCNALASVPLTVTSVKGDAEKPWPFPTDLQTLIWQTEAALLLYGAGYWERGFTTPSAAKPKDVRWVNPNTVTVQYQTGAILFQLNGVGLLSEREIVYFREFDPAQDVAPGPSAGQAALENARLLHYTTRMASKFFEHGAIFPTLLNFDYAPDKDEAERVEGWFRHLATGLRNAYNVLALRTGKTTATTLMSPVRDLAVPELSAEARRAIATAFGIPITMLEDAANYATASQHDAQFWETTIRPRARLFESTINGQLLNPLGLKLVFDFEAMDIFQADEAERAGSLNQLTTAGVPLLLAMDILGYDLDDEQRALLEGEQERKETQAEALAENLAGVQPEPTQPETNVRADLRRWERMALRRLKDGKPLREFVSEAIPASLQAAIAGALEGAETVERVKFIFADARRWEGYP